LPVVLGELYRMSSHKKNNVSKRNRRRPRQARKRRTTLKAMLYGAIVLVVLGLAGYLLWSSLSGPDLPPMEGNVIDVAADMSGFNQNEIRVKVNEPVTVRLTSLDTPYHTDGGGKHQWAVDELDVDIIAPPKGSSYATFTPTEPGTYEFYCDICCGGRANPTMQGTLIVEA